jgi:type IV secretory pathway TraG/TraD family ATPase VirD4
VEVSVLEGYDILPSPPARVLGDDAAIAKHALFLGAIGSGKTHAITHYVRGLRFAADDVLVFFDTKGDFLDAFGSAFSQRAVLGPGGGETWNVFADVISDDGYDRADQVHEIASAIFSDALEQAGQNAFFASAARDVFGGVLLAMSREGVDYSNADLRKELDSGAGHLHNLLAAHDDLAGTARYLDDKTTAQAVLAFLQQTVSAAFSGMFRQQGSFSVRNFVRSKGGRALFVEYDMAIGARLLPAYRVLIDLAIKEALEIGRRPDNTGRVFFVLDEFALLPKLTHIADGINFGRGLGLRFIAGCQNISQVLFAYGQDSGRSILSGFGTVFAFRLMDAASRDLVRQRFGTNRKQLMMPAVVRTARDEREIINGNVIEDWALSSLRVGECVVAPSQGPPFRFTFPELQGQSWPGRLWRLDLHMQLHLLSDQARCDHLESVVTPCRHCGLHLPRSYRDHRHDERRQ